MEKQGKTGAETLAFEGRRRGPGPAALGLGGLGGGPSGGCLRDGTGGEQDGGKRSARGGRSASRADAGVHFRPGICLLRRLFQATT